MQAEHFCKGEKGAAKVSRELVKFAGERLPEYRWLEGGVSPRRTDGDRRGQAR